MRNRAILFSLCAFLLQIATLGLFIPVCEDALNVSLNRYLMKTLSIGFILAVYGGPLIIVLSHGGVGDAQWKRAYLIVASCVILATGVLYSSSGAAMGLQKGFVLSRSIVECAYWCFAMLSIRAPQKSRLANAFAAIVGACIVLRIAIKVFFEFVNFGITYAMVQNLAPFPRFRRMEVTWIVVDALLLVSGTVLIWLLIHAERFSFAEARNTGRSDRIS
ncbi:MAG: hypothetical protein JWP03_2570 [Phycisphaerales bacterium]|jgi:hypothetical protein|nr:hypothetical protein [Phycisphaerales bacterium]